MDNNKQTPAGLFRILVVDDAADAREVLQTHLEDAGYVVRACASVEDAVRAVESSVFDIIITDLRMPKASGLELIQYVRNNLEDIEILWLFHSCLCKKGNPKSINMYTVISKKL